MLQPEQLSALIRNRRAVFPTSYNDQPIAREIIEAILENARWAPTHKLTEPWRFKVFTGKSLERLGLYIGNYHKEKDPSMPDVKYQKMLRNPVRSACVIAICMKRHAEANLPEWEEVAAVACAVQNMWLTCTAYGIGSYWSSPSAILNGQDFLQLEADERCLGLFYMGHYDAEIPEGKRSGLEDKVVWVEE